MRHLSLMLRVLLTSNMARDHLCNSGGNGFRFIAQSLVKLGKSERSTAAIDLGNDGMAMVAQAVGQLWVCHVVKNPAS